VFPAQGGGSTSYIAANFFNTNVKVGAVFTTAGTGFRVTGRQRYEIDPTAPDQVAQLVAVAPPGGWDGVVHLWGFVPSGQTLALIEQYLSRRHVLTYRRGHAMAYVLARVLAKPRFSLILLGVFAGTAVLESEGRRLQVNGGSETDIANGILRVSQSATQRVCFLDGHREPDPFSLESHDHLEGAPGHSHGLGAKYVLHERHGLAKARNALETLNYKAEKVLLLQQTNGLAGCAVLVVAGPKVPLLPAEVAMVQTDRLTGDSRRPARRRPHPSHRALRIAVLANATFFHPRP
jgi:hypothetical protein